METEASTLAIQAAFWAGVKIGYDDDAGNERYGRMARLMQKQDARTPTRKAFVSSGIYIFRISIAYLLL